MDSDAIVVHLKLASKRSKAARTSAVSVSTRRKLVVFDHNKIVCFLSKDPL